MRWLKQLICLHWFDIGPDYEYEESSGPIVCMEQSTYRITAQRRVCSKCGLSEQRRIGDSVCLGWQ